MIDAQVTINIPGVDQAALSEQVRLRAERRRPTSSIDAHLMPSFDDTGYPNEQLIEETDALLFWYLRIANETYAQVDTQANLASSPAVRLPVIGRLWQVVREQVHQLVLYYVNRVVAHQTNTNRYLISALNRLVALTQRQQQEIVALRAQIDEIRRRIDNESLND